MQLKMPDYGRWDTGDEGGRRNVMCHDCTRCDDGISSDVHPGQDGGGGSDPHIRIDRDRLRRDVLPSSIWFNGMTSP